MFQRYLPGLNALRFYAAVSVVVSHCVTDFTWLRPATASPHTPLEVFFLSGADAVALFFVLSGFLITYLLLNEQRATGSIAVGNFYRRRALRIWPLYFALVAVGALLAPLFVANPTATPIPLPTYVHSALVALLLPNVAAAFGSLGVLGHLWSIGIEEQFYAAWPWVIRKAHHFLPLLLVVIVGKPFLEALVNAAGSPVLIRVVADARFECMAIGAAAAYLYAYHRAQLSLLYRRYVQRGAWLLFVVIAALPTPDHSLWYSAASVVFAIIILNVATNPQSIVNLESARTRQLGDLSYGIYMWHYPLLFLLRLALNGADGWYDVLLYPLGVVLSLLAAAVSYRWLETPFLRLKGRYTVALTPQPG